MPALSGQVITTITNSSGAPIVCVSWFFDPVAAPNAAVWTSPEGVVFQPGTINLNTLRNNPIAWTDPSSTVWPVNTGALIGANLLAQAVRMVIRDISTGAVVRRVLLPANTGKSATKTQLANAPAPDGPYVFSQDLNGLSFDLSGAQIR